MSIISETNLDVYDDDDGRSSADLPPICGGSISAPTEQSRRSTACNTVGGALRTLRDQTTMFFSDGMFLILLFSSILLFPFALASMKPWIHVAKAKQGAGTRLTAAQSPAFDPTPKFRMQKKADTFRDRRRRQSREYADPTSSDTRVNRNYTHLTDIFYSLLIS